MKQIVAKKGNVECVYRFNGRDIYLKANNMQYSQQLIAQIKAKGGKVYRHKSWLLCDIFGDHTEAKLGNIVLDLQLTTPQVIEETLVSFFAGTLKSSQFEIEISDI